MALSGHWFGRRACPLLGVKQTSLVRDRVSVNDPRVDLEENRHGDFYGGRCKRTRRARHHAARVFTTNFPSGHATLSAVTYLTLGALLAGLHDSLRFKLYFLGSAIVLTIAVGISRIYLGVHYPTDVLAGWCIGAAWAAFCWSLFNWLQNRGRIEPPAS